MRRPLPPLLYETVAGIAAAILGLALATASSGEPVTEADAAPEPEPIAAEAAPDSAALPEIHVPRWVFAVEDTMELPALFKMSTIDVRSNRLHIGEIVDRCIRREEEVRERIESLEQTAIVKTVFHVGGYGDEARGRWVIEQADRMIHRKPDVDRAIPLKREQYKLIDGKREEWPEDEDMAVKLEYRGLSELPFYLRDRDGYSFRILSREIVGDSVLYEVRLTPKSDFEIAPEGTIWIDSSNFQILREEFDMSDRVPLPMFVKTLGPIIRERERVGDVWVWRRMMIRVDLRTGLLKWIERDIPEAIEFVVTFRDFRVNEPPAEPGPAADRAGEGRG